MKVIFLEEVPNVARMGETREVADGYARNYLLPRKLAVLVGSVETNMLEAKLKKKARLQAETEAELTELAKMLEGKEVVVKAKAGAEEKLYGSITSADIAAELAKGGLNVDKRKIELAEPIKQVGSWEITIKLMKDLAPKIKVTVTGEEAAKETQALEAAKEEKAAKEPKEAKETKEPKEPKKAAKEPKAKVAKEAREKKAAKETE